MRNRRARGSWTRVAVACGAVLAFRLATSSAVASWEGKVVDGRTGEPVAGARVSAGVTGAWEGDGELWGRTDGDGNFRIKGYKAGPGAQFTLGVQDVNLRDKYLDWVISRTVPARVTIRMTPRYGFFKGRVIDRATGKPIRGVSVSPGTPGAFEAATTTDDQGLFQIVMPAYMPAGENTPHLECNPGETDHGVAHFIPLVTNYLLEARAEGYKPVNTWDEGRPLSLLSSTRPEIHTYVEFSLVPVAREDLQSSVKVEQKNPFPPPIPDSDSGKGAGDKGAGAATPGPDSDGGYKGTGLGAALKAQEPLRVTEIGKLIAWYLLDGDARDRAGDNHGRAAAVEWVPDRLGNAGSAARFNGRGEIVLANNSVHVTGRPFTLAFWLKTGDRGDAYVLEFSVACRRSGNDQRGYAVIVDPAGRLRFSANQYDGKTAWSDDKNWDTVFSGSPINDDKWHEIYIVFPADGKTRSRIYVDGALSTKEAWGCPLPAFTAYTTAKLPVIGHSSDKPDYGFRGDLDDLRLYEGVVQPMP